jgi:transposase
MPQTATHALGIDFHKARSTFVLIDNDSKVVWKRTIPSTPDDFRKTLGILKDVVPLTGLPAAIEPVCGWRWAFKLLEESSVDIEVANPRKVRIIADSLDKTDDNDAARLAWIRLVDKMPTSYVAPDDIADLRRLVRGYMFLVRERSKLKNRIQSLATDEGLNVTFGNTSTTKGLLLLEQERGNDATYTALIATLRDIEKSILPLYAQMVKLTKEHPIIRRLATMPSVGPVTATVVCAEVGDFHRFRSGKQIASFAGLVPRERSSGGVVRQGHITKLGSNVLRYILIEAATRVRHDADDALSAYLAEITEDHTDKKPKMIRVALARMMLVAMHRMIVTESDFDSGRFVRNGRKVTSEKI